MIRIKAAFFSMTPRVTRDDDISGYLRWHLLDHMPEQYQLPGIVYATRWIADGEYGDHRVAGSGSLERIGGIMNYLVGEPVQLTHYDFMELGARLSEVGRFPEHRPPLQLTMPALLRWYASPRALISAEVVPFRPHRGVTVIVEQPVGANADHWLQWLHAEHYPALLDTPGVAGAWMYGSTNYWTLHPHCHREPQYITVVYLDEDPLITTAALAPTIESRWVSGEVRPLFAGPLRSMIQWEAWLPAADIPG